MSRRGRRGIDGGVRGERAGERSWESGKGRDGKKTKGDTGKKERVRKIG